MARVISPHDIARNFAAHVETLVTARSRSGANNVWRHFNTFFLAFLAESKIVITGDGESRILAHGPESRFTDLAADAMVSARMRQLMPEEATSLLGRAFAGKAKTAVYNAAADLRTFFGWALSQNVATIKPAELFSPLAEQDSLAVSQAWLTATYEKKGTRATRKSQFRLFFLAAAEAGAITNIDIGREARAYVALKRRTAARRRDDAPDPSEERLFFPEEDPYTGSLTHLLIANPADSIRAFRNSIANADMEESYLSTVRRFYAWLHDEGHIARPVTI